MIDKVLIPNVQSGQMHQAPAKAPSTAEKGQKSFEQFLNEAKNVDELKFSSHALQRLNNRKIPMGVNEVERLSNAVAKAVNKGGKDTLVLMNGTGFIVDAKTKTVVTALDLNSMKEQVFTNIDTTVLG
jgi:flagellar operon protein